MTDYSTRKVVKVSTIIAVAICIALIVVYIFQAQKIQRKRLMRLNGMYRTGMITRPNYEKLRQENTFLNALFNPKD